MYQRAGLAGCFANTHRWPNVTGAAAETRPAVAAGRCSAAGGASGQRASVGAAVDALPRRARRRRRGHGRRQQRAQGANPRRGRPRRLRTLPHHTAVPAAGGAAAGAAARRVGEGCARARRGAVRRRRRAHGAGAVQRAIEQPDRRRGRRRCRADRSVQGGGCGSLPTARRGPGVAGHL